MSDAKKSFLFEQKKPISDRPKDPEGVKRDALLRLGSTVEMARAKIFEGKPLIVMMRIVNDRLDYSFDASAIADRAALANCIIEAVREFETEHQAFKEEKVTRSDGRTILYNRHVEIDWAKRKIYTSFQANPEEGAAFMRAMSVVVTNLQEEYAKGVPQN